MKVCDSDLVIRHELRGIGEDWMEISCAMRCDGVAGNKVVTRLRSIMGMGSRKEMLLEILRRALQSCESDRCPYGVHGEN